MKIFPSTHKIKSVTDSHVDTDLNIPLAYVELNYDKYAIDKEMKDIASRDILTEVLINQEFDNSDIQLFNKFKEKVNMDNLLTRVGNKYYYQPKNMVSFTPQTFKYKATIKKKLDYKIANKYNLNIAAVDDPDSLDLSQRMASAFSNPGFRNLTPPNISVNNNRTDIFSFTDITLSDTDFLFIESPDGIYYDDSQNPIKIDKDLFLNNNTNLWIAADLHLDYIHENMNALTEFHLQNPKINSNAKIMSDTYFNMNALPYNPNVIYHNIFRGDKAPILIIEHIGKGYEILSHSKMLKDITLNANLLFEVLMFCYLQGYKSTESLTQWISNEVPDYQIESNKLQKKKYFISDLNVFKYFGLKDSELIMYEVRIDEDINSQIPEEDTDLVNNTNGINFIGMSGGRLLFDKINNTSTYNNEPKKPIGWISIYTGNQIVYLQDIHYIVETDMSDKIFTITNENDLDIKIMAFKSTSIGVDTQMPFDIKIPFIKTEVNNIQRIREADYLFYINKNNQKIDFCFKEDFKKIQDSLKEELLIELFEIKVHQTSDAINIIDMRQLGGGLVEEAKDNYNLLDIGHINGRPYRKAGTLVITLPKKYEQYENKIQNAINKYIGADELPVIMFIDK